jgi:hypothetical protein
MADEGTTPDPAEGARRRKRQAPTIDLTATDVSAQSGSAGPADAAADSASQNEDDHSRAGGAESQPGRSASPDWLAVRPMLIGGIAGAALVAVVLVAIWLAGFVPARYSETAGVDPAAVTAVNARLSKVETAIANVPANDKAIPDRLAATDNAMKSLGIALAALSKRNDEVAATATEARARADQSEKTAAELRNTVQNLTQNTSAGLSPSDVDNVQKRLATLEDAVKAGSVDRPARLAVVAVSLRDAVARGTSFATELGEVNALGGDERLSATLAPYAASGVPAPAATLQELSAVLPLIVKISATQPPPDGFIERLQANAEKLVRIRPVNAPAGDETSAVLARLDIDVAHADINGALADLGKLGDKARAPAQDWIARAHARQAAIAAADELVVASARALGKR